MNTDHLQIYAHMKTIDTGVKNILTFIFYVVNI